MTEDRLEDDALETALRALRHRDRSARELDARLAERGFGVDDRERALSTLQRTGVVDDARFARARAQSLAARCAADAHIRHELAEAGVPTSLTEQAIALLEPEIDRARRIVGKRGATPKTARYLRARGYPSEVVGAAVATDDDGELP